MVISLILAFASGVTIVLSRMITAHLGAYVGTLRSALANYAIGFGGALLLFLLRGAVIRTVQTPASPTRIVDFSGGLLGVMTVLLCIILVPKLPSYVLTLLIFLGQLSSGITLDFPAAGIASPRKNHRLYSDNDRIAGQQYPEERQGGR